MKLCNEHTHKTKIIMIKTNLILAQIPTVKKKTQQKDDTDTHFVEFSHRKHFFYFIFSTGFASQLINEYFNLQFFCQCIFSSSLVLLRPLAKK
jgi:hypothetical protein